MLNTGYVTLEDGTKLYTVTQWSVHPDYTIPYDAMIWGKSSANYYEYGKVVGLWYRPEWKSYNYIILTKEGKIDTHGSQLAAGYRYSTKKPITCDPRAIIDNPEEAGYSADTIFYGEVTDEWKEGRLVRMDEHIEEVITKKYMIEN